MAVVTGAAGSVTADAGAMAEITGFSFDESATVISDTNLNDTAESNVAGRTSWSGSIEVMWDKADTTGQGVMLIGASVALVFYPEGNSSGKQKYTGTGLITGRSQAVADESVVTQTFAITGTGALVAALVV